MKRTVVTITAACIVVFAALQMMPFLPFPWLYLQAPGMVARGSIAERRAGRSITYARQFRSLFPEAQENIARYTGLNGQPAWESRVGLYGRYHVSLRCDITFGYLSVGVEKCEDLLVSVTEVDRIIDGASLHITYTDHQKRFGAEEWDRLIAAGGDFGAVGYEMEKSRPLSGFERTWRK